MAYTFKSWSGDKEIILLDCPFCGGEPKVEHVGNDCTKKRWVEISCKTCRCRRTDAAIRYGFDWLEDVAVKAWNQRPGNHGGAL